MPLFLLLTHLRERWGGNGSRETRELPTHTTDWPIEGQVFPLEGGHPLAGTNAVKFA